MASESARRSAERRSYPGGRPFAHSLAGEERLLWAKRLRVEIAAIPGATQQERLRRLADSLGVVRRSKLDRLAEKAGKLDARIYRGTLTSPSPLVPSLPAMQDIINGRTGVSPSRAFEIGEALWLTGIQRSNGLETLDWAESYHPHIVGIVGNCILLGDRPVLKRLWSGLMTTVRNLYWWEGGAVDVPWMDAEQHNLLDHAFDHWVLSREDSTAMEPTFQAYLAIHRLPPDTPHLALSILRNTTVLLMLRTMRDQYPDWVKGEDVQFEEELARWGISMGDEAPH